MRMKGFALNSALLYLSVLCLVILAQVSWHAVNLASFAATNSYYCAQTLKTQAQTAALRKPKLKQRTFVFKQGKVYFKNQRWHVILKNKKHYQFADTSHLLAR